MVGLDPESERFQSDDISLSWEFLVSRIFYAEFSDSGNRRSFTASIGVEEGYTVYCREHWRGDNPCQWKRKFKSPTEAWEYFKKVSKPEKDVTAPMGPRGLPLWIRLGL